MCRSINRAVAISLLLFTGTITGYSADAQIPGQPEGERYVLQTRVVHGDTGEPAAGVEVSWIGYRGGEQCLVSGADGTLEAPLSDAFGWVTLLYGRQGGLVTQALLLFNAQSLNTDLVLGPPATLLGTIKSVDNHPLKDCTVRLCADTRTREMQFESRTDELGTYIFESLPPGTYYLKFEHPAYFARSARDISMLPQITLSAGEIFSHDMTLEKKARLKGRVFGPGNTDASGATVDVPRDGYFEQRQKVTTDERGRFDVQVVPDDSATRNLSISSHTLGSGDFAIPATEPGDVVKDIVVQLHGVARVTGTVLGPNGEPVVGARVSNGRTDNDGHFDTGFVSLHKNGKLKVPVGAPIWKGSLSVSRLDPVVPQLSPDANYYKDGAFTLAAKHGDVLTKDVVLERIPVRTLRGTVQDVNGGPAAHVTVAIYSGSAPASLWLEDLTPFTPPPPARVPHIPSQTFETSKPALLLARVPTDDQGRWEVRVLSENKSYSWLTGTVDENLEELTLAAADATLEHTALKRVKTEVDSDSPIEVDLVLEATPDDLMTHVNVVDDAGAPLPGVAWQMNGINGPFISDQQGRVTLPRIVSRIALSLMDNNLKILSAAASGQIVRPPVPASDLPDDKHRYSSSLELTITGPNYEQEAPYIRTDANSVSYSDFDTSKGTIVITVGHADSVASGR